MAFFFVFVVKILLNQTCHRISSYKKYIPENPVLGGVDPATLSEPEFFILLTILNVNMYIFITGINH